MTNMMQNPVRWLVVLLLAVFCVAAVAAPSPFVNSRREPHAVLYLNYKMIPSRIYPVRIWMVNGKLTNRSNQGVIWMKPDEYTFNFKLTKVVNLDYVPGVTQKIPDARQTHEMKLSVEAGKAYYIGAKFDPSGKWQPEVWKTTDIK
ncbi:MAG: hypothetical protein WBR15_10590 [Gammaproteobacteria bacterium]